MSSWTNRVTNCTRPTFTLNLRILTRDLEKRRRKKKKEKRNLKQLVAKTRRTRSPWNIRCGERVPQRWRYAEFFSRLVEKGWWRMISYLRSFRGWDRNYEWVLRCFQRFKRVRIFPLFVYCVLLMLAIF